MRRNVVVVAVVALLVGGGYVWTNYRFEVQRGENGIEGITVRPVAEESDGTSTPSSPVGQMEGDPTPTIRIATFHLDQLDERKLDDARTGAVLARIVARCDVMAVQGLRSGNGQVVRRLVDRVNADGGQYDFVAYPAAIPRRARQDIAILFNRQSVEVDRATVRPVEDPEGRFVNRPLIAQFRAKGAHPGNAFTFVLVNVQANPDAGVQCATIEDVFRAVHEAQPAEDDVIVLGDLGTAIGDIRPVGARIELASAVLDVPTTLEGSRPTDNLLFDPRATTEFTGRAEVLDLMREFDLTWREASAISGHLPVWAEFSSREGGMGAQTAQRPGP